MKKNYYQALHNSTTPAARLATWQAKPSVRRLIELRAAKYHGDTIRARRLSLIKNQGPELSSLESETPTLWTSPDARDVLTAYPARTWERHKGWYSDDTQEHTYEGYAVELARFPGVLFEAVLDSMNGDLRVALDCPWEIDFSECGSDYDASDARKDTARQVCRSADSAAEGQAEESREYYRKDRVEQDIEENKSELATLRQSIRELAHELKTLCPLPLASQYPAAAAAVMASIKSLLGERRGLMRKNKELAASI